MTNDLGGTLDTKGCFFCLWQMSSNNKDLTELDKTREKSPALRGGGMDMNADVCL